MIGKSLQPLRLSPIQSLLRRALICGFVLLVAVTISACGTVATPEWAADAQSTRVAVAETAVYQTESAPTATPTLTPTATSTPIPPTATATFTPLPPTQTATTAPTETLVPVEEEPVSAVAASVANGDPVTGQVAYNLARTMPDGQVWACSQCHSITPDEARLIGPGMWNIAVRAGTRVEGQAALDYIHTSIVAPNEYITPPDANGIPYPENLMPQHYANETVLSEPDLYNIISYLQTLQ